MRAPHLFLLCLAGFATWLMPTLARAADVKLTRAEDRVRGRGALRVLVVLLEEGEDVRPEERDGHRHVRDSGFGVRRPTPAGIARADSKREEDSGGPATTPRLRAERGC